MTVTTERPPLRLVGRQPTKRSFSRAIRVLEEDPELGAGIDPAQFPLAAGHAVAAGYDLRRGRWDFHPEPDPASLGALIIDGLIVVRVEIGDRSHLELLVPGDVISPWVPVGVELSQPSVVTSKIVSDLRIALLDRGFALRTARWPEIHGAIMHRLIQRSRRLSLQAAINSLPRIEERLELTLWLLADRIGRVTADGVRLGTRFTHTQLAEIVAAQRPSVTTAIRQLEASGRLIRTVNDDWLLCGKAPERLTPMAQQAGVLV